MIALLAALTLAVPYLTQTEALCGGAAAAMVFRFLGDRHADVQQFAPLVDRRAGGIADTVLVNAIRERGWIAEPFTGSIDLIRTQLAAGHPLILLIEDRPSRYHYVVAVGADAEQVIVHDPTWGPERRIAIPELQRRWQATGYWTLLITAGDPAKRPPAIETRTSEPPAGELTDCDRRLDAALDRIEKEGVAAADSSLGEVSRQCPSESGPLRELAAVRFSQKRWREAAVLSEQALERNAQDNYAWNVLGSTRFMLDDRNGALQAWNHTGAPKIDSVQIAGLTRARYAFISQMTGLEPNTLLTAGRLALARRRLSDLPDRVTTQVEYRPDSDGFATMNVTLLERQRWPNGIAEWAALGAPAAINREMAIAVPGTTGQGEVWQAGWRWWRGRPRVAGSFSAPLAGSLAATLRVDGFWEAQSYGLESIANNAATIRQDQTHAGLSVSRWMAPYLRVEAASGLDVWDGASKMVPIGGLVEPRWFGDHLKIAAGATRWLVVNRGQPFGLASMRVSARSTVEPERFAIVANVSAESATSYAPLAVWPGAGDGRARPALLRAHPLLTDGAISGPMFGRHVQAATIEAQRWLARPELPRIGVAIFTDAAHAAARLDPESGRPFQVDAGVGLRLRIPGSDRTIRVDYAHGLRDQRANALTVGIVVN